MIINVMKFIINTHGATSQNTAFLNALLGIAEHEKHKQNGGASLP
jgi:hypothetical protein